jgi:plasmid stability protein
VAQLVVRNLDETVKKRLKARAVRNGRSLEGEVRDILAGAVKRPPSRRPKPEKGFGTRLVEIFAGKVPPDFKIPDIRSELPRPAKFDE